MWVAEGGGGSPGRGQEPIKALGCECACLLEEQQEASVPGGGEEGEPVGDAGREQSFPPANQPLHGERAPELPHRLLTLIIQEKRISKQRTRELEGIPITISLIRDSQALE